MIRPSEPLLLAHLLLFCVGCAAQNPESPEQPAVAPSEDVAIAERHMAAGEVDEALLITDRLLKEDDGNHRAHLIAARGNIVLFESGRQGSQWFLDDAVRHLEAALDVEEDNPDALVDLAWCRLKRSEFEEGRDAALEAVRLIGEQGGSDDEMRRALLQAAENQMQMFVDARRAEQQEGTDKPSDDVMGAARELLATLNTAERFGPNEVARVRTSQVYQWLGRTNEALTALEDGIRAQPSAFVLHDEFLRLHYSMGMRVEAVAAYKRLLKEAPGNTALLWSLGRAHAGVGDELRSKSTWDGAATAYAAARDTFKKYDELRPGDRTTTAQWLGICGLSRARVEFERGRLNDATELYFAAYDECPQLGEYDMGTPKVFDTFGGNYVGGLFLIGQAISEQSDPNALRNSLEFYEQIIERHPGQFGTIYNNAALSARDLGVQVEASATAENRAAKAAEAMDLWERSHRYYVEAVKLEPDDPRIVNDCGLMLIYHLHRDYDRARELFDRATELGQAELDALPEEADEASRQFLEEATGDAWQNIGVLLFKNLNKPFEEAKPFLEKAVEFYPYQRREAAFLLRSGGKPVQQDPKQDDRKKTLDAALAKAKPLADDGDFDGALLALDKAQKELTGYAPFHYYMGWYSLQYAQKSAAEGGGVGLVDGLFNDSVRHLRRSVELDSEPIEPRLQLANALLATGDAAGAAEATQSLLSHMRSMGSVGTDAMMQAHKVRAQSATRAFIDKKQAGEANDEGLLRAARTSFRELEPTANYDASMRQMWTTLEQWAGASEQAIQVMLRAFAKDPALIGDLVQLGASTGTSDKVIEALKDTKDATQLWYLGRAWFDRGVQLWSTGKPADAEQAMDTAVAQFDKSKAANEGFKDSCEQWTSLCMGQKGIIQVSNDKVAEAQASLLQALKNRPDTLTSDLGGGSSIKRGILIVGDRYFQKNDLGKLVELYKAAWEVVPTDVDFANNLGLFARDHGNALERQRQDVGDLYEVSYAAYTKAHEADPTNVRLRNDRALILIYHLNRELDTAEQLLRQSISEGEKTLAENPPTDASELQNFQEAVGDAYGNLGYLQMQVQKKYPEARKNLEKSLEFWPFRRRAGVRQLRMLDDLEKKKGDGDGEDKEGGN